MCMQCVASSTPMLAVGFGVLRRRALGAWVQTQRSRLHGPARAGGAPLATPTAGPPPGSSVGEALGERSGPGQTLLR